MSSNIVKLKRGLLMIALALGTSGAAQAALITNGFTFAVASGSDTNLGSHFHSNTGGSFGNPAGKAEVGRYSIEEVRGLSEYNITGLGAVSSAFVTFDIFKAGGLFNGTNSTPFTGSIIVDAYAGNNQENINDYQAASLGQVGTFTVTSGVNLVGDVFSFDITSLLNAAIGNNSVSFGIRLREDRSNPDYALSRAWTFEDFRLTTDNQCSGASCQVPEPGSLALLGFGLAGLAAARRRKH